jgi:hypothetical protein
MAARDGECEPPHAEPPGPLPAMPRGTVWLARVLFTRGLGLLYGVAFATALFQWPALLGSAGLTPADRYMARVRATFSSDWDAFMHVPSILWFVRDGFGDAAFGVVAASGAALATVVALSGAGNAVVMLALWALYHALVAAGQVWYSFGWESLLLEAGFLAIVLGPMSFTMEPLPARTPPPRVCVWGYRWLLFRLIFGAGLIKVRGDECWRSLESNCLVYFYETQPVPNPLSWAAHHLPRALSGGGLLVNHFTELVAPFMLLCPHPSLCAAGGLIQVAFQVLIIIGGNLSFLNYLSILPALFTLDDAFLLGHCPWLFSRARARRVALLLERPPQCPPRPPAAALPRLGQWARKALLLGVCCVILRGSLPVVQNLLQSGQVMNTSFDAFRLVNTYGAFGSVGKVRTEIIVSGSADDGVTWREYEFRCKPGDVARRPCWIAPYHYRLDWLAWFAGFGDYNQHPWAVHLAQKLLQNDTLALSLLGHNPFPAAPPRLLRIDRYEYHFAPPWSADWWTREYTGPWLPPIRVNQPDVLRFLVAHGYIDPPPALPAAHMM